MHMPLRQARCLAGAIAASAALSLGALREHRERRRHAWSRRGQARILRDPARAAAVGPLGRAHSEAHLLYAAWPARRARCIPCRGRPLRHHHRIPVHELQPATAARSRSTSPPPAPRRAPPAGACPTPGRLPWTPPKPGVSVPGRRSTAVGQRRSTTASTSAVPSTSTHRATGRQPRSARPGTTTSGRSGPVTSADSRKVSALHQPPARAGDWCSRLCGRQAGSRATGSMARACNVNRSGHDRRFGLRRG